MMKTKKSIIILLLIFGLGFITLKFTSKAFRNTDTIFCRISNLLNDNNPIEIIIDSIDKNQIEITWISEDSKKIIYSNGEIIGHIGNDYGPNHFKIKLNKDIIFKVGHFKTANWASHDYLIKLLCTHFGFEVTFIAKGRDYEHTVEQFDLNGKPNGSFCAYFENGKLSVQQTYIEGLAEGQSKYYFENGTLRATTDYLHGKLNGYSISYLENGEIEFKTKYINGEEIKENK